MLRRSGISHSDIVLSLLANHLMSCFRQAHTFGLVHVLPSIFPAQDILDLLLLEHLALVVALVDDILVRTGHTLEAVLAFVLLGGGVAGRDFGDAQHVAAGGADCWTVSVQVSITAGWIEAYRAAFGAGRR
jgi:hypothetical protein